MGPRSVKRRSRSHPTSSGDRAHTGGMSHALRAGMPARRLLLLASMLVISGCAAESAPDDAADSESGQDALTEGWTRLGLGVAYKSTGDGNGVYIGYAGYSV